jgi:predicted transcriptional regulator
MSTILLPLNAAEISAIFDGSKKYVLRKDVPKQRINRIVVCSKEPKKPVVGEIAVKTALIMECDLLWEKTKEGLDITKEEFNKFYKNKTIGIAYKVEKAHLYNCVKSLEAFGLRSIPSTFVYLKECPYCHNVIVFDTPNSSLSNSKSEEHIIPKSLGNEELIIPKGIICDSCNNYFAREIEKPFLNNKTIVNLRFKHFIPSRKDRVPETQVLIGQDSARIIFDHKTNSAIINGNDLLDDTIKMFLTKQLPPFLLFEIDVNDLKEKYYISRFLVKIFTEINIYYATQLFKISENRACYTFDEKMSELFNYVRFGNKNKKVYNYTVKIRDEYYGDDFISRIDLLFDNKSKKIIGMNFDLYELRFTLYIS